MGVSSCFAGWLCNDADNDPRYQEGQVSFGAPGRPVGCRAACSARTNMEIIKLLGAAVYCLTLLGLCAYGLHRYWMLFLFRRHDRQA